MLQHRRSAAAGAESRRPSREGPHGWVVSHQLESTVARFDRLATELETDDGTAARLWGVLVAGGSQRRCSHRSSK